MTGREEEVTQPVLAEDSAQFREGEKRDQKDGEYCREGEYALQRTASDIGNALAERFTVIPANASFLKDFESCEDQGESDRLENRGIDERLFV
jgi:hypothetical protein